MSTDWAMKVVTCTFMHWITVRELWRKAGCLFCNSAVLGHRVSRGGFIQVIRHLISECDPLLDHTFGSWHWIWSFGVGGGGGWGDEVMRAAGSISTLSDGRRQFKHLYWRHGGLVWYLSLSLQLKWRTRFGNRNNGREVSSGDGLLAVGRTWWKWL